MKVPEPRKLKSGTWFIQMRLNGVSVPVSAPTAKECRDTAQLIKAEYRAGRRAVGGKSELTMRQAIDKYIMEKQNSLSPSTIRGYRTIQDNYYQQYMDVPIKSISNWQQVYDSERDRLSSKTLNNSFSFLASVYKHTAGAKITVEKVPTVVSRRNFLDYDEILRFCAAIKGLPWEAEALLALHSLRASELLDLTWEDIDLDKGIIRVRGATVPDENEKYVHKDTNKTEESARSVPIFIPRLLELLKQRKSAGQRLRYYMRTCNLSEAIKTVCKENKLPEVTLHGLRHSFASLCLLHLKIPEDITMKLGGWSDYMTVHKIYTHVSKRDLRQHTIDLQAFFKNANENANDA